MVRCDQEIKQHLHQVFDHQIGNIALTPEEAAAVAMARNQPDASEVAAEAPLASAEGLLRLFSSPDSLREAVILNEIFPRPEQRWGMPPEPNA